MILVDLILFLVIAVICVRAYLHRQLWLALAGHLIGKFYRGRGFWRQLFSLGPVVVSWLLLCHWLANHGARGLGAGGILFAMTLALDAMRSLEEDQKMERGQ